MKINFTVSEGYETERADVFLSCVWAEHTRSNICKLIDDGLVELNGKTLLKASKPLKQGDKVEITVNDPVNVSVVAQDIPIDIVYQDELLAVVNKQQGLTVHPANGVYENTLVNALLYHVKDLSGINGELRPGIVHRLDKDTSGLMLVAKNDFAHNNLAKQIQTKQCKRTYIALVEGVMKEDSGTVNQPIGRSPVDRKKMAIVPDGRVAVTNYRVVKRYVRNTLVEFNLVTGRTHQIRVHTKYLGHPVVGDLKYGYKNQRFKLDGQLLHSRDIEFFHPKTNELMHFSAPIPGYFQRIVDILDKEERK